MPTITLENGKKLTLPDGATQQQMDEAVEDYMSSQAAPQGAAPAPYSQEQLEQKLPTNLPTNMGAMPNGAPLPFGVDPAMIAAQNKTNAQTNAQNAQLQQNLPFLQQVKAEEDQGKLATMAKSAINTMSEFGAGIGEAADK